MANHEKIDVVQIERHKIHNDRYKQACLASPYSYRVPHNSVHLNYKFWLTNQFKKFTHACSTCVRQAVIAWRIIARLRTEGKSNALK